MPIVPPTDWETERLSARAATSTDADAVFVAYATDTDVAKYMTWRPHRSVHETIEFLRTCESNWSDSSAFTWLLRLKTDGTCVGVIEARVRPPAANLGYALARQWWRQGLMREATSALIDWAMRQPEIYRVWATCDVDNIASAALLESVGMQREGVLRRWIRHPNISDAPRDCFCYSIVKAENR